MSARQGHCPFANDNQAAIAHRARPRPNWKFRNPHVKGIQYKNIIEVKTETMTFPLTRYSIAIEPVTRSKLLKIYNNLVVNSTPAKRAAGGTRMSIAKFG